MFCENGYDRKTLRKKINIFEKKTRSINNSNNNNTDKSKQLPYLGYQKLDQKFSKKIGFRVRF